LGREEERGWEGPLGLREGGGTVVPEGVGIVVQLVCEGEGDAVEAEEVVRRDAVPIEALEVARVNHVGAVSVRKGLPVSDAKVSQGKEEVGFNEVGEEGILLLSVRVPDLVGLLPKGVGVNSQGGAFVLQSDTSLLTQS
jgi:hypothetical protein